MNIIQQEHDRIVKFLREYLHTIPGSDTYNRGRASGIHDAIRFIEDEIGMRAALDREKRWKEKQPQKSPISPIRK